MVFSHLSHFLLQQAQFSTLFFLFRVEVLQLSEETTTGFSFSAEDVEESHTTSKDTGAADAATQPPKSGNVFKF